MGYKTILVHCNDRQRLPRLIEPAVGLSVVFRSHLVAVSVAPPIAVLPAGMPGSPGTIILDQHTKAYRADNPVMKAMIEEAACAQNISVEWREADAGSSGNTVAGMVTMQAHAADLIIASQTAPNWRGSLDLDVADRLALDSGRPVLIIPNARPHNQIPKRIVLGWADRREAARAIFDALPLLQRADKVTLVEIDPDPPPDAAESRNAICATLARHSVICEAETAVSRNGNAGDALLRRCEQSRADLLVMGCYGHSRLREFVLGGASRHVLAGMTLPVLMSH